MTSDQSFLGCSTCEHAIRRFNNGNGATTCALLGHVMVAVGKTPTTMPEECPKRTQSIESKPLAVGDRVRLVHDAPGFGLGAGCVGTVRNADEWTAQVEFTRPRSVWLRLTEVERIDPRPPSVARLQDPSSAQSVTSSAAKCAGVCLNRVATLTAERDAARVELAALRAGDVDWFPTVDAARKACEPERYPLWCHDSGGAIDEGRFSGPFMSEDEALGLDPLDLDEDEERPIDECLRRCRALRVSEADASRDDVAVAAAQAIADVFNDEWVWKLAGIGTVWWPDSAALVSHPVKFSAEAEAEILAWADKYVLTDVYMCEGDEP